MKSDLAPQLERIVRLAARGDGVTGSGFHARGALPGDMVEIGGTIVSPGPHHQTPPCQHFDTCGGCQLQHAEEAALTVFIRERVINAALGQGLEIGEELPTHHSPRGARRRATLHALRRKNDAVIGFRASGSHTIIDLAECPVLDSSLSNLIAPMRALIAKHGPKGGVDVGMTLCDSGVDIGLKNFPLDGLSAIEDLTNFAKEHALARVTLDDGYGPESQWEPEPVKITLGGVAVPMPPGAFLQATQDAQDLMVADVKAFLGDKRLVADLFSGLGTFAFSLRKERKVLAAEADRAAHLACKSAASGFAQNVYPIHRDLFRNPLSAEELSKFDAVLLDPPRAGAKAQISELAKSKCKRVVYISCNPSSWARDGAVLAGAGFALTKLRPIGQFRWSTHVELVSLFERD